MRCSAGVTRYRPSRTAAEPSSRAHIFTASHSGTRSAFTLLEVLLTLGLLVILSALTFPLVTRMFDGQRLRMAADQLRAELGSARAEAINSGLVQAIQFQLDAGAYSVSPWQDESGIFVDPTQGVGIDMGFGSAGNTEQTSARIIRGQLPDGTTFFSGGMQSTGTTQAEDPMSSSGSTATPLGAGSQMVLFYPDGTTTDVEIWLAGARGQVIGLQLRGLTGVVTVSDIMSEEQVPR